jgi:hypothetical protein
MPKLILHALQVNVRGGRLPEPEDNGCRYLKFPLAKAAANFKKSLANPNRPMIACALIAGERSVANSRMTFARPKAPHVAGRALSASAGEQVNRPTHIAMRPLRQKSSRFLSRGALEASQSRGLFSRLTGTCPPIKRRTEGLRIRTCCRRHATSISSVTVAPGRIPMPGVRVGSPLQLFPPPEIAEFPLRFQSACAANH